MLKPSQLQELPIITQFACNYLTDWGYKQFLLKSLYWDGSRNSWIVEFVIDSKILQQVSVAVQLRNDNSYQYGGIVR